MVLTKPRNKVVRALPKGQLTIPRDFRDALGIEADSLLTISLVNDHLEIAPLRPAADDLRRYSERDIARFLKEDRLDAATAKKVQALLHKAPR